MPIAAATARLFPPHAPAPSSNRQMCLAVSRGTNASPPLARRWAWWSRTPSRPDPQLPRQSCRVRGFDPRCLLSARASLRRGRQSLRPRGRRARRRPCRMKLRVQYLREERAGPSLARNRGIEHSTAEIVALLDDGVSVGPRLGRRPDLSLPHGDRRRLRRWSDHCFGPIQAESGLRNLD
jgi:hypothetical protein